jgi:thiosulfate/3-mercaptopyruvate sulfurtransferase
LERQELLSSGRSFKFGLPDALAQHYSAAGVTPDRPVITYCGRGFAGACCLLALELQGYENARLYDGSWAEWSADLSLPI